MDRAIAEKIMGFLTQIGVPFERASIEQKTFLPGLHLHHGVLQIDLDKLAFAGDILHEAGHIAVCEPQERQFLHGDIYKNGLLNGRESQLMHGEEMAVTHLGLPLNLVFHEEGYRGGSNSLIDAFSQGKGFGFPLLVVWEMVDSEKGYPYMQKWIREMSWL
ncbi:TPA: hypothetical protein RQK41_004751 [Vibrio vulnificus]|nr:hypothetical protein [Vibrio vulnificus]HDY7878794.1 hypothetical protein [Vibrio vulnificus]